MKIDEVTKKLEERFPLYIQEDYDNTGTQVVFPDEEVKNIIEGQYRRAVQILTEHRGKLDALAQKGARILVAHALQPVVHEGGRLRVVSRPVPDMRQKPELDQHQRDQHQQYKTPGPAPDRAQHAETRGRMESARICTFIQPSAA